MGLGQLPRLLRRSLLEDLTAALLPTTLLAAPRTGGQELTGLGVTWLELCLLVHPLTEPMGVALVGGAPVCAAALRALPAGLVAGTLL